MSGLGPGSGSGSGSGLGLGLGLGLDFVAPCGKRRQPVESELPTYGDALGKVGRRGMWDRRRGCECRPQDAPLNSSPFEDVPIPRARRNGSLEETAETPEGGRSAADYKNE